MGNRGRLHDPLRRIVRRTASGYRAWVTCRLEFRGRHRTVMAPDRYTELFFLDEATALAAGHRPCGECRRPDFLRFKAAWLRGNPDRGLGVDAPIAVIDRELHRDRLDAAGRSRTFRAALATLPDGVFVAGERDGEALLVWDGRLVPWTPAGYGSSRPRPSGASVTVLTPRSSVAAIVAGYAPDVHGSLTGRAPARRRKATEA